ncbi:MAG: hypothetical protein SVQ76_00245 [Candidatus Nanohaloarchaea archaeon]|nr:hypothetical protein [Candidatus Nanohaloarchaea archaeon]
MVENIYLAGRFQPPTNHHVRLVRYMDDSFEPEEIHLAVVDTYRRSGANPFTPEEVEQMLVTGLEDAGVEADTGVYRLDENILEHRDSVVEELGEPLTFFTREWKWAAIGRVLDGLETLDGSDNDIELVHEPRDNGVLEDYGEEPYTGRASEVRRMIGEENEEWRRYVPDGVEELVDGYDEAVETCREEEDFSSGKYDFRERIPDYVDGAVRGKVNLL